MDYAAGGELYEYINKNKPLSEKEARRMFRQIAAAIYYCHSVSLTFCLRTSVSLHVCQLQMDKQIT